MDQRDFFDIFNELSVEENLKGVLGDAKVNSVVTNPGHTFVRIEVLFQNLVPKRQIWKLEDSLKHQYFNEMEATVRIRERYNLPDLYTPSELFEQYRDSLYEELYKEKPFLYAVLKRAEVQFPDDHSVHIVAKSSSLTQEMEDELLDYLGRVFRERCGVDCKFSIQCVTEENHSFEDDRARAILARVSEIEQRYRDTQASMSRDDEVLSVDGSGKKSGDAASESGGASESGEKKGAGSAAAGGNKGSVSEGFTTGKGAKHSGKRSLSERTPRESGRVKSLVRSNNPDVIFGKDVIEEAIPLSDITDGMGEVVVRGQIFAIDEREIKNERHVVSFDITDNTDSISCKIFVANEFLGELHKGLEEGAFVRVKGSAEYDTFAREVTISRISGIVKIPDFMPHRVDNAKDKRVELHLHTKMSDSDGVSDIGSIIKTAKSWGHKALAITDHGVVQAFPDALHAVSPKDEDFKIIYGCEGYLVEDTKAVCTNVKDQDFSDTFVVFDLETTGLNASKCSIIEIGAVKVKNSEIIDRFSEFVNPHVPIPYRITELTGIRDQDVRDAEDISMLLPAFKEFCGDAVLVAHNADFDTSCIKAECKRQEISWDFTYMDTVPMSRYLLPELKKYKLDAVAKLLGVVLENHHRAVDDAEATAGIFLKLRQRLLNQGITGLRQLNEAAKLTTENIRSAHAYHVILLAKNDIGRINLYRLVSDSHLKYFSRVPKIPKSLLEQHREGLIIGSACEAGELFQALVTGKDDAEVVRIASFYDYLEVQPIGNNAFMLREEKYGVHTEEDLRDFNRRIVSLGDELKKPVVATCDVHFLNPEDEIYRRIIMAGKGFSDADDQAPLYLHTTQEMLEEFSYLGEDKAYEVVVKNSNRIADMCDRIAPTRPDKCPPVIENSDQMLRDICYHKAHEIYGENLPEVVSARLERELNSIISNGYAVMYIIAQKLVWKSVEDGYLVGSRGSVGSSFVATMAGITEVNPLSPHYICESCHYVDFDSPEVLKYAGRAGCDMPDKVCPNCGKPLIKEGFDIPFETFLGFKGNKEPDIDLNFSGDYQNKAHRYTEVIFGEGQTFRAGTIGTLAEKTAYGLAKKYYEERGVQKRTAEFNRIVKGCTGVRRSTGQHPGGIIVLPVGEEINTFTPVQHPANKMDTDIITTHFDYHSIDENLLKLDILGHDDPTMIRMLEDLTPELRAVDIPLDDPEVMSLFKNTSALGVEPEDLWNCDMGTLGIPEFGTDFAMNMLREAKPQEFSDLVRISGLSHGTDVWIGNARDLILSGQATISTAICTRDDIMTYLIGKGVESEESFKIMEAVRKGLVAKGKADKWPEWVEDMKAHDVPDWYIESCKKIKYMFPKAHAVAYVMMAWRIAYYKINYPLSYYAAFFSIRATTFDYEMMCQGQDVLEQHLQELDDMAARGEKFTAKQDGLVRDMRIVQEMYARGFSFLPIDLYESDAVYFKIVDGKLLPPFSTISGMGEQASESLAIAASEGKFLSLDDLKNRGKIPQTCVDTMVRLGIVENLPKTNQISLFDFM